MKVGDLVKSKHDGNLSCGYGVVIEHMWRHVVKVFWIDDSAVVETRCANLEIVYEVR